MVKSGDIISYWAICKEEEAALRRGMNYRLHGKHSVILMNVHPGAPYADRVEAEGKVLVYEGHNAFVKGLDPKSIDQRAANPDGTLTQNGLFDKAATEYKEGKRDVELVTVYEKIKSGIWVYNGIFKLVDTWQEVSGPRKVFKFRLEVAEKQARLELPNEELEQTRVIPTSVKLEVWKRDKGQCVKCGSKDNLHFDHILPFSKGGTSLTAKNIQLLCARHNLEKHDKIE